MFPVKKKKPFFFLSLQWKKMTTEAPKFARDYLIERKQQAAEKHAFFAKYSASNHARSRRLDLFVGVLGVVMGSSGLLPIIRNVSAWITGDVAVSSDEVVQASLNLAFPLAVFYQNFLSLPAKQVMIDSAMSLAGAVRNRIEEVLGDNDSDAEAFEKALMQVNKDLEVLEKTAPQGGP